MSDTSLQLSLNGSRKTQYFLICHFFTRLKTGKSKKFQYSENSQSVFGNLRKKQKTVKEKEGIPRFFIKKRVLLEKGKKEVFSLFLNLNWHNLTLLINCIKCRRLDLTLCEYST
jgi:hypothetical protein